MLNLRDLFLMLCFGFCSSQEIDSTSTILSTFEIESISIENFNKKHFVDRTFECSKSTNQLKKVQFLNIELLLPEQDSIYLNEFEGKLQLNSMKSLGDSLSFGLFESQDRVESNLLYKTFQNILIDDVFNGQALDFGVTNLVNLNKVYWIKSDYSDEEVNYVVLVVLFEDTLSKKLFMIVLDSTGNLNKAICKYYPSIQSIKFKNP